MESPERISANPDRLFGMSVPDMLNVDSDDRTRIRKSSGLSTTSDNMMVPDRLLVDDMINPYHVPHLDTPPKTLTMNNIKRRSHLSTQPPNGTVAAPVVPQSFEQDEDILTLANRLLDLHQKVINLESKLAKTQGTTFSDYVLNYLKIFGISFAAAILVQYISRRR